MLAACGAVGGVTPTCRRTRTRCSSPEPDGRGAGAAHRAAAPAPQTYVREEQLPARRHARHFRRPARASPTGSIARLRSLRELRPGTCVSAEVGADGDLISLTWLSGRDTLVRIAPTATATRASEEPRASSTRSVAMKSGVIRSSLFARERRRRHPRQRRDAARRRVRRRHRLPSRPAQGRPLHRGLRGCTTSAAAPVRSRARARRRVRQPGQDLPRGALRRRATTRPTARTCARRSCARRSSSRASAPASACACIRSRRPGARTRASTTRAADRHAGARGRRRRRRVRRREGRLRQGRRRCATTASTRRSTRTSAASAAACTAAQRVAQNDTIGFVGQTGWATRSASALRVPGRRPVAQSAHARHAGERCPVPQQQLPRLPGARRAAAHARLDLVASGEPRAAGVAPFSSGALRPSMTDHQVGVARLRRCLGPQHAAPCGCPLRRSARRSSLTEAAAPPTRR